MREHQRGERFDRVAYADRRMRQLFGAAGGEVAAPHLEFARPPRRGPRDRCHVAVALGARVEHKHYRHWPAVLRAIVAGWPADTAPPQFWLLGQGDSARADLAAFSADFVAAHARVRIDSGDLGDAARDIARCDAFLGVDGGLMHVAVGVGTPGLALFARIDPRYFLRPGSSLQALPTTGSVAYVPPERIAAAFLEALPAWVPPRDGGLDHDRADAERRSEPGATG